MVKKQISLNLKRNNDVALNAWEIQDFIAKLASNYYKIDLINQISKYLNEGIKPEKFLVMKESFDFKNNYKYLKNTSYIDLTTSNGAKNFFHLGGYPIPFFYNEENFKISLTSKLFREINTFLNKKKVKPLNKDRINLLFKKDIEDVFNTLKNESIEKINQKYSEKNKNYINEIEELIEKEKETLLNFENNKNDIYSLKEAIYKNTFTISNNPKQSKILSKYFEKFLRVISSLERPIVGILNEDNSSIEILCKSYIHKQARDSTFLDFKNFSHNSPTIVNIVAGLALVTPCILLLNVYLKNNQNKQTSLFIKDEEENLYSDLENSIAELKILQKDFHLNETEKINNEYLKSNLNNLNNKSNNTFNNTIDDYGFNNINFKSNIIDLSSKRKLNSYKNSDNINKLNVASKCFNNGLDDKTTASISGLSLTEIHKLRTNSGIKE